MDNKKRSFRNDRFFIPAEFTDLANPARELDTITIIKIKLVDCFLLNTIN